LIHPQHQLNLIERKIVSASFVGGHASFLFFFVKSQDPKGQMKFQQVPAIPAIAVDGLAHGVACLQFLDSNLEVLHFVKEV
jgi:hypothetical protein